MIIQEGWNGEIWKKWADNYQLIHITAGNSLYLFKCSHNFFKPNRNLTFTHDKTIQDKTQISYLLTFSYNYTNQIWEHSFSSY